MAEHIDAFRVYARARAYHEEMEQAKKAAYSAMKRAEDELIDAMLDEEITGWNADGGASIGLRRSFSIAVNQDNQEDVENWLLDKFGDVEPFRKTSLDKSAVRETLGTHLEDGNMEESDVPAFLKLSTRPIVVVRGWAGLKERMRG